MRQWNCSSELIRKYFIGSQGAPVVGLHFVIRGFWASAVAGRGAMVYLLLYLSDL